MQDVTLTFLFPWSKFSPLNIEGTMSPNLGTVCSLRRVVFTCNNPLKII